MRFPRPEPPAAVQLIETRDGAPPPQPDQAEASDAPTPPRSRLVRLRDVILALVWP